jgi:hypothetical protein
MPLPRRHAKCSRIPEEGESGQPEESGNDSCPLLEDETSSDPRPQRMCDVRRIDNGLLRPKRSLGERIRGRKNRVVQRVLVACRLAEPSRDLTFRQVETNNRTAIEQLSTLRGGLFAHSQSAVSKCQAVCYQAPATTIGNCVCFLRCGLAGTRLGDGCLLLHRQLSSSPRRLARCSSQHCCGGAQDPGIRVCVRRKSLNRYSAC